MGLTKVSTKNFIKIGNYTTVFCLIIILGLLFILIQE